MTYCNITFCSLHFFFLSIVCRNENNLVIVSFYLSVILCAFQISLILTLCYVFKSPYPDEGLEFTTLWARKVRCTVTSWTWQMRDFPQLPLNIRELHIWGFLIGAEQEALQRGKLIMPLNCFLLLCKSGICAGISHNKNNHF